MNTSFVKELVRTNYILLGFFALIIIVANIVYRGTTETLIKSMVLLGFILLAMVFKINRIKAKAEKLDERLQIITYRAIAIGFYCALGIIFWFYARELVLYGQVSSRTVIELLVAIGGYVGGYLYFSRKY